MSDVAVVGGGVIGLAIAWKARESGFNVTLFDPHPARGASWAAAGMLGPASEAQWGEENQLLLNAESGRLFPTFVHQLESASGHTTGYVNNGSLFVGFDTDDVARLGELLSLYRSLSLAAEPIQARACRNLEPGLATSVRFGLSLPDDHQVNNRSLLRALQVACERTGVKTIRSLVSSIEVHKNQVTGVLDDDGAFHNAVAVVIAAGAWSGSIAGLPEIDMPPVRPVKGEILRLANRSHQPIATRVIRGFVRGSEVYVVPRIDNEVVVGATSSELGFDTTVSAGAVHRLLDDARRILPDIDELEFIEAITRHRPATTDNGPLIGPIGVDGLLLATAHYRNGILLAPITANAIISYLKGDKPPLTTVPFTADRLRLKTGVCS